MPILSNNHSHCRNSIGSFKGSILGNTLFIRAYLSLSLYIYIYISLSLSFALSLFWYNELIYILCNIISTSCLPLALSLSRSLSLYSLYDPRHPNDPSSPSSLLPMSCSSLSSCTEPPPQCSICFVFTPAFVPLCSLRRPFALRAPAPYPH